MDIINFVLITAFLANLFLGSLMWGRVKRDWSTATYAMVIGAVALWTASMFFYRAASPETSLMKAQFLYISASLIPGTFLYFTLLFPSVKFSLSRFISILTILPAVFIIFLIISDTLVIKEVITKHRQEKEIIFGPMYMLYVFYISGYFSWALFNLFQKYRKAAGVLRMQISYILLGTLISIVLGSIFNLFLPSIGEFRLNWLGNVTTLVMVSFITYAIVKKQLFDIRVVLTQILVAVIAVLLFVNLISSQTSFEYLWKGGLLIAFLAAGYLLIKSVMNEIKQREELEKLSMAKSEFMSIASHQLRTPLSVIKGYVSLLEEKSFGDITSKQKEALGKVFKTNEEMIAIVNDLLNVTRAEEGRLQYSFEKTDFTELVKSAAKALELTAKQKGLTLEYRLSAEPIVVNVDKDKITQAISNLIDNAIKYTERGGVTITAAIDKTSTMARVQVADTGLGIGEEEMKHLFESFSRGKAGTKSWAKGAGMGLYIAKQFVEAHKGKIWAASQGEGKGSTFCIELPVTI